MRLWGTVPTATEPYLSLSGTSMAAPVVSGTIALMLQANPALTPNAVKAVLQFTAENRAGYDSLAEGAGFLNARGAVELAQALAAGATLDPATPHADPTPWSGHVIWGNRLLSGGAVSRAAAAIRGGSVVWGAAGVLGPATAQGEDDNIVWGTQCGGADCTDVVWGAASGNDNTVWATSSNGEGDNIVWGTADAAEDVLWGGPGHRRRPRIAALTR
jgi:subtilisin family serine protease